MKGEIMMRERTNSLLIVELFRKGEKRKERQKEKKEVAQLEAFKESTKERSPVRKEEEGWEDIKRNKSGIQGSDERNERTKKG